MALPPHALVDVCFRLETKHDVCTFMRINKRCGTIAQSITTCPFAVRGFLAPHLGLFPATHLCLTIDDLQESGVASHIPQTARLTLTINPSSKITSPRLFPPFFPLITHLTIHQSSPPFIRFLSSLSNLRHCTTSLLHLSALLPTLQSLPLLSTLNLIGPLNSTSIDLLFSLFSSTARYFTGTLVLTEILSSSLFDLLTSHPAISSSRYKLVLQCPPDPATFILATTRHALFSLPPSLPFSVDASITTRADFPAFLRRYLLSSLSITGSSRSLLLSSLPLTSLSLHFIPQTLLLSSSVSSLAFVLSPPPPPPVDLANHLDHDAVFYSPIVFANDVSFNRAASFFADTRFDHAVVFQGLTAFHSSVTFRGEATFLGAVSFAGAASFRANASFKGPVSGAGAVLFEEHVEFWTSPSLANVSFRRYLPDNLFVDTARLARNTSQNHPPERRTWWGALLSDLEAQERPPNQPVQRANEDEDEDDWFDADDWNDDLGNEPENEPEHDDGFQPNVHQNVHNHEEPPVLFFDDHADLTSLTMVRDFELHTTHDVDSLRVTLPSTVTSIVVGGSFPFHHLSLPPAPLRLVFQKLDVPPALPSSLTTLHLLQCRGALTVLPSLSGLRELKLQAIQPPVEALLLPTSLHALSLVGLPTLRRVSSFPLVTSLHISMCNQLTGIEFPSGLRSVELNMCLPVVKQFDASRFRLISLKINNKLIATN